MRFCYYAIFVDDFSRYSWLFHLSRKLDVFQYFCIFINTMENIPCHNIKYFQCVGGGGEFKNSRFVELFQENGISFCISCSHALQQNSLVERKYQHVIETIQTLLIQSNIPHKFWAKCSIYCDLINYHIMYQANGSIECFKTQLVAQGFHQQPGIDYHVTFSLVVKLSTIRLVLSLSFSFSWDIHELDVKCIPLWSSS